MARGQRDPALEQPWRERVAQWRASGLSVREFCLRRGLTEPTFHYWRLELRVRDAATATASSQSPVVRNPSAKSSPPTFVPLTVIPAATLAVEVRCPSGHVVCMPACEVTALANLFAALERRVCGESAC